MAELPIHVLQWNRNAIRELYVGHGCERCVLRCMLTNSGINPSNKEHILPCSYLYCYVTFYWSVLNFRPSDRLRENPEATVTNFVL